MKSVRVCSVAFLLSVYLLATATATTTAFAGGDWEIELVPSRNSAGKGAVLYATKPLDKFYIVLHNTSGKDQHVWRDWCPWGYENFTLHAALADGRKVVLSRTLKKWDKSYPDAALVRAGKSYVFEVHLAGRTWKGGKDGVGLEELSATPFKLTVVYQVPVTEESAQKHVWTGKVSSKPMTVTIRR